MVSLKKILPVILLVILIIWGVYDVAHKINTKTPDNVQPETIDNGSVKEGIKIGNQAPDFELTTLDGRRVKLSDYRGKKVVLNFWATWCPPCRAEIPDLEKFYTDFKDKDIVILGVNLTDSEKSQTSVSTFAGSNKMTYPILLDKEGTVSQVYQVSGIPTSYFIDTKGIIRNKIVRSINYKTVKNTVSSMN